MFVKALLNVVQAQKVAIAKTPTIRVSVKTILEDDLCQGIACPEE
jgi:hypothetical protein